MRILLFISRSDTIAGAQRNVLDLAEAFIETGHTVLVVAGSDGNELGEVCSTRGLEFKNLEYLEGSIRPAGLRRAALEFGKVVEAFQPDVVHSHSFAAGILGRLVPRGVAKVFTAHGWTFTEGTPALHRVIGLATEYALRLSGAHVLTVSRSDYHLGRRLRVTPANRLHHVPYGIPDLDGVRFKGSRTPRSGIRFAMVARFEAQKDHRTAIQALGLVKDLPVTIDFVGDGPLLPAMKRLAKQTGVEHMANFVGYTRHVDSYLHAADAFLLVTNYEGLPLSIMEALRMDLPVLATGVGGIPEMIDDGKSGYILERRNPQQVANCIRRIATDSGWLARSTGRSRVIYEMNYRREIMAERVLKAYNHARGVL